jgi:hypothetical protein
MGSDCSASNAANRLVSSSAKSRSALATSAKALVMVRNKSFVTADSKRCQHARAYEVSSSNAGLAYPMALSYTDRDRHCNRVVAAEPKVWSTREFDSKAMGSRDT